MAGIDSFLGKAGGGGGLSSSSSAKTDVSNRGGDYKAAETNIDNRLSSGVGNRGFINNFAAAGANQTVSQDGLQPGPSLLGASTGGGMLSSIVWLIIIGGMIWGGWQLWKRRGK